MTEVTAQARHKQSREAALEEVSLQTSAKSRQRRCGCYVLQQTIPHVCGHNRKSSVADEQKKNIGKVNEKRKR